MWNNHSKKTQIPGLGNCALKLYFLAFKMQLCLPCGSTKLMEETWIEKHGACSCTWRIEYSSSALGDVTLLLLSNLPRRSLAEQSLASGIQRKQFLLAVPKSLASSPSHWSQPPPWRLGRVFISHKGKSNACVWAGAFLWSGQLSAMVISEFILSIPRKESVEIIRQILLCRAQCPLFTGRSSLVHFRVRSCSEGLLF